MHRAQPEPYQLLALLGSGGHGEVYQVACPRSGEHLALKVVRPTLASQPAFTHALHQECHILQQMDHVNIVRVHELTEFDGRPALLMELLQGADLKRRSQQLGPLTVEAVCDILEQLLDALAYIHARGVIHRDIKPANIFLTHTQRVVLTDFGVARAAEGTPSTTGRMKGSLGYIAPERFRGQVLPEGDLYAVGLVGWELLTGIPACPAGDLVSRMHWHMHTGPSDPRNFAPGLPDWLCDFLAALLADNPDQRPANGADACILMRRMQSTGTICSTVTLPPTPRPTPPTADLRSPMLQQVLLLSLTGSLMCWLIAQSKPLMVLGVVWLAVAGSLQIRHGRGGMPWAMLWLLGTAGVALPLLDASPHTWILSALAGLLSWVLCVLARSRVWPLSLGEVAIYMLGLTPLCTLLWSGILALLS